MEKELIVTPSPQVEEVYNRINNLPSKDVRTLLMMLMGQESYQIDISEKEGKKKLSLQ